MLIAGGATEADPIEVGDDQVLVYEAGGLPAAYWLESNLFLVATSDTGDLEPLVIALHLGD